MHTLLKLEHKLVVITKKNEVNKQFRKYYSELVKKIRGLKSSDPKTYWKIKNDSNSERHEASLRISSQTTRPNMEKKTQKVTCMTMKMHC